MSWKERIKQRTNPLRSIYVKIAFSFVLLLLLIFQIVGIIFVQQLKTDNLKTFKQRTELSSYVENTLVSVMSHPTKDTNARIHKIIAGINNDNITTIQVVDPKGVIRGVSNTDGRNLVGQKTTDNDIKRVLYDGKTDTKMLVNRSDNHRYYVTITPLLSTTGNTNTVVGAVYIRANLDAVYNAVNNVTMIFATASLIATVVGLLLALLIARTITQPIEEMKRQTTRIARGDYSGRVKVYGNDELGELATAVNDLSVRVENAQASTEAERRRLDSVLTHMSDGVLATDRRGLITIINDKACALLGVAEHDVIGKSILDVLGIRGQYAFRDLLEKQDEIKINLSDDDHEQILKAFFSLIQRQTGYTAGLVCVLHDVTEQQRVDRERRQFVSNVSHELRTPLTSVRSYIEALNEGAWKDPEVAPEFLRVTQDETDRMIRMINDLLNLSRMDSGTVKLELELVNINELFSYILDRFDMMLAKNREEGKPQLTIKRDFTATSLWAEVDQDKFTQVIDNIMTNAVKYSPDGGTITCRLQQEGNNVVLSVADQGLGIPKKDIDHIFDRFFRVDKARSRAQGGTGLGLAISKEVIELLHGKIWVTSTEGKGSTFFISLPSEEYEEGDLWDEDT